MTATTGGSSRPSRSYRDAVAGMAVPPPAPVSFDTASFRPMGMLTRDQGMKTPGPAREDLRVKLDAQRAQRALDDRRRGERVVFAEHGTRPHSTASTSGSKGDGEGTCGDMPHEETTEPVTE
ncbi:hypothetical protein Salat_2604200 [Sesamum alatum]|uniref:Uncharacterized protein n=1 Tax=Sesamum alatum TaxID=300844 RepID=A0AAE1XP24_9LAMI|nr:hypothetical protein Salat_2604200 [Sesamum alatum]